MPHGRMDLFTNVMQYIQFDFACFYFLPKFINTKKCMSRGISVALGRHFVAKIAAVLLILDFFYW